MIKKKKGPTFSFFFFLPNNCKHTANKPTDVCVLSGTAELDLTSELKTRRRGTMYWSLSNTTK